MRDEDGGIAEDARLGDETLDPNVVGERTQRLRVAARTDGDHDIARLSGEPVEDRAEDAELLAELGPIVT